MSEMKIIVLEGEALEAEKKQSAQELFGMTKKEAHIQAVCIDCKTKVRRVPTDDGPGAIYSSAGAAEYNITGMCEHCYDKMFEEPESTEE